jgi:hypothetical protein
MPNPSRRISKTDPRLGAVIGCGAAPRSVVDVLLDPKVRGLRICNEDIEIMFERDRSADRARCVF